MNLGLQDKPVLVLASSAGIGRGVATELAREGARVMLFSRSKEKLEAVAREIGEATGNRPSYFAGDIAHAGDAAAAVEKTAAEFGGLWALFNNTGGPPAGSFDQFDDAAWQSAFEVTLLGYVRAIRAALPHLRKGGGGRIVNNASTSTKQAIDGLLLSNTFRSGLVGLGKSLARELGPDRILVNTVGAGRIDTAGLNNSTGSGPATRGSPTKNSAANPWPAYLLANTATFTNSAGWWPFSARRRTLT